LPHGLADHLTPLIVGGSNTIKQLPDLNTSGGECSDELLAKGRRDEGSAVIGALREERGTADWLAKYVIPWDVVEKDLDGIRTVSGECWGTPVVTGPRSRPALMTGLWMDRRTDHRLEMYWTTDTKSINCNAEPLRSSRFARGDIRDATMIACGGQKALPETYVIRSANFLNAREAPHGLVDDSKQPPNKVKQIHIAHVSSRCVQVIEP
jgi:hypothetical protein